MIRKSNLLKGIDLNTEQIVWQGKMISDLKLQINILNKNLVKVNERIQNLESFMDTQTHLNSKIMVSQVQKTPEKIYVTKEDKKNKSCICSKQPRTKDGKFAKKK